jgi:hypothetical protein
LIEKDTTRVAAGLKAAVNNPNVSGEAKERAAEQLENMEGHSQTSASGQESNRVLGGYKATLTVCSLLDVFFSRDRSHYRVRMKILHQRPKRTPAKFLKLMGIRWKGQKGYRRVNMTREF